MYISLPPRHVCRDENLKTYLKPLWPGMHIRCRGMLGCTDSGKIGRNGDVHFTSPKCGNDLRQKQLFFMLRKSRI